eukprot:COSAG02_NODE_183_length_30560_cov_8.912695_24_plen_178_part_00
MNTKASWCTRFTVASRVTPCLSHEWLAPLRSFSNASRQACDVMNKWCIVQCTSSTVRTRSSLESFLGTDRRHSTGARKSLWRPTKSRISQIAFLPPRRSPPFPGYRRSTVSWKKWEVISSPAIDCILEEMGSDFFTGDRLYPGKGGERRISSSLITSPTLRTAFCTALRTLQKRWRI